MNAPAKDITAAAAPAKPLRLKKTALMLSVPLLLAGGATAYWFAGGGQESTENANLHQARIPVAPTVGGRVVSVNVTELQKVKAGDVLFQVDPEPYRLALAQAEAALNGAHIQVQEMKAAYQQAVASVKLAQDDADYLSHELDRQIALSAKGVATPSDVDDARHLAQQATEKATLAQLNVTTALAALGGAADAPTDAHPAVAAALAELDRAKYNLTVTTVTAPADGVIYQASSFRQGAMLTPGQTVFALVESGDVWVEANFKETQLVDIGVGQPAEVTFDMAPGHSFSGKVEAIGAGTGAEFSLLPAQNATGNWVKVTQRVPVRIRLDHPESLAGLSSGLSAEVTVDTRNGQPMLTAKASE